ncbi:hypothetical protein BH18THE1_BH18THE1_20500 [soil metagenome]
MEVESLISTNFIVETDGPALVFVHYFNEHEPNVTNHYKSQK